MRRSVAFLGAIGLAVTAQSVTAQEGSRSIGEATVTALDICANSAFGGEVDLGRSKIFLDLPVAVKERMPGVATLNDVPDLIQRFVATAKFSRMWGASQIIALGADDGQIWVVQTRDQNLCSIAITGVEDKDGIRQLLVSAVKSSQSWILEADSSASNEAQWVESITARERPDGAMASVQIEGLASQFASPDGIQVELNVRAVPAEAPAGSPIEQEGP